jgi:hypothetical protein
LHFLTKRLHVHAENITFIFNGVHVM